MFCIKRVPNNTLLIRLGKASLPRSHRDDAETLDNQQSGVELRSELDFILLVRQFEAVPEGIGGCAGLR